MRNSYPLSLNYSFSSMSFLRVCDSQSHSETFQNTSSHSLSHYLHGWKLFENGLIPGSVSPHRFVVDPTRSL